MCTTPVLNYEDKVKKEEFLIPIPPIPPVEIKVRSEIKLWHAKYDHIETPLLKGVPQVGKGDDIGFILVFGNDGEETYKNDSCTRPTLEDTLEIDSPMHLKLMSLCLGDDYQLWAVAHFDHDGSPDRCFNSFQLTPCSTILHPGTYKLQLRKNSDAFFDIPCHSICCISMLFQIEFPPCDCPRDCD